MSLEETLKTIEREKHQLQKKEIQMISRIKELSINKDSNSNGNSDQIEFLLENMIQEKLILQKKYERDMEDMKSQQELLTSRSRLQTSQLENRIRDLERVLIDSDYDLGKNNVQLSSSVTGRTTQMTTWRTDSFISDGVNKIINQ